MLQWILLAFKECVSLAEVLDDDLCKLSVFMDIETHRRVFIGVLGFPDSFKELEIDG